MDKLSAGEVLHLDLRVDLGQRCPNRDPIKGNGLATVPRKHDRFRRKGKQLMEAVVERLCTCLRFLLGGMQIRTPNACEEEGVSGQEQAVVQQITRTLSCVSRRMERGD